MMAAMAVEGINKLDQIRFKIFERSVMDESCVNTTSCMPSS